MSLALSRREGSALALTAVVAGTFLFHRFAWGPFAGELSRLDERIAREEITARRCLRLRASRETIEREHRLRFPPRSGPARDQAAQGPAWVERLARRHGVTVRELRPLPGVKRASPGLEVVCLGRAGHLLRYLEVLEAPEGGWAIERLALSRPGSEEGPVLARVVLQRSHE